MNDNELLQAWASRRDEDAFAELVRRYLNLVYASASRQLGGSALAQDVTQAVFLVLARKAGSLGAKTVLSGWLFRTTCFVAARAQRAEQRRTHHESAAAMQPHLTEGTAIPQAHMEAVPHLDAALAALPGTARDALVLRFFEGKSLRVVGEQLGVNEDAAKKRVSRALEKLRQILAGKGVILTAAGVISLLSALPSSAAPAGLASQIVTTASTQMASASTAALVAGAARDWLVVRTRQLLPWAVVALILLMTGLRLMLPKSGPRPAIEVTAPLAATTNLIPPSQSASNLAIAPAPQPGPSKILLTVRSARGRQPLPAQVVATFGAERGYLETRDFTCDSNGSVEIPVFGEQVWSVLLWVSAPGHVPVTIMWKHHEFVEPILLYQCLLEPGRTLQGTVQDESGQPIANAQILFDDPGLDLGERENVGFHRRLSGVTSDENGHFQSGQMPSLRGKNSSMGYIVTHPDFVRARMDLAGPSSLASNHIIVLHHGFAVTGRVVGPDDAPIPGAKVEESHNNSGPRLVAYNARDGTFSIGPLAAGPAEIEVSAGGYKSTKKQVQVSASTNEVVVQLPLDDGSKNDWELGMEAARTVRVVGTVVDAESGEPLPQFRIRLNEHRGSQLNMLGNSTAGRFDWPVRMAFHSEFSLEADAEGFEAAQSSVRPVENGTQTFEFKLKRGKVVNGRVMGLDGQPLASAVVGLNGPGFGLFLGDHFTDFNNGAPQTITGDDGSFSLPLKADTESLAVVHETGFAQVPVTRSATFTVVLQPWGTIEGTVMTAGHPAADQQVLLHNWLQDDEHSSSAPTLSLQTKSDAQGRFRFDRVPPVTVALSRYYNFNESGSGAVGIGQGQRVEVRGGETTVVTMENRGRRVIGRFQLSKPVLGYSWRNNLQTLEEVRKDLPPIQFPRPTGPEALKRGGMPSFEGPEFFRYNRAMARRDAQLRKFFPIIQPDGSFHMDDVAPGNYTLHLGIYGPLKDSDELPRGLHGDQLGHLDVPVAVPDGDFNDPPLDLGTITIAVKLR